MIASPKSFEEGRSRPSKVAAIIVLLSVAYYLGHLVATLHGDRDLTVLDDSYMFVRYADNLLLGKGIAWNPDGVQTFGPTSLPYVFVVALLRVVLPLEPGLVLSLASWLLGLIAAISLCFTCLKAVKANTLRDFVLICAVILPVLLSNYTFLFHAFTGLETMLAVLSNTILILGVIALLRHPSAPACLLVALCAYGTYLVRPDSGLFGLLFPALSIWLLLPERRTKDLLLFMGSFAGLLGLDGAAKYLLLGDWLPLSFYAKQSGYYEGYVGASQWNPVSYTQEFIVAVFPFILTLSLLARKRHARLLAAYLIPVLVSIFYYFSILQIMGYEARFYFPALPFLVVSAMVVLYDFLHESSYSLRASDFLPRLLLATIAFLFSTGSGYLLSRAYSRAFLSPEAEVARSVFVTADRTPLPALGYQSSIVEMTEILKHLPPGGVVAASEVGFLGASAPHISIIDVTGLNDAHIAHHGFSTSYLLERTPDIIWFPNFHYTGIVKDLLESPDFIRQYDYYPGAYRYGLALRKDSPRFTTIYGLVGASWRRNYPAIQMSRHPGVVTTASD